MIDKSRSNNRKSAIIFNDGLADQLKAKGFINTKLKKQVGDLKKKVVSKETKCWYCRNVISDDDFYHTITGLTFCSKKCLEKHIATK